MKFSPSILLILLLFSCKKEIEPLTSVVNFTATSYDSLGAFDQLGRPTNLVTPDVISPALSSYVKDYFPETVDLRTSHPELLSSFANSDIAITQNSDVYLTFVSQGTNFRNTIAFYTYPTSNPPDSVEKVKKITYIFPNAGRGTTLNPGDKIKLGRFLVGTSIGFVLLKDAYNPVNNSINNNAPHFCSNDALNPERAANLKKHVVLLNYPAENKVLVGFEDVDRTDPACDHDFNDVVVYATVKGY
ncbi:MAG: DUF4114 domain-containing protein [Bacteroidota bacterium]|nr:DUF4114 domain-containing protein [Bacteroidota bacterium]